MNKRKVAVLAVFAMLATALAVAPQKAYATPRADCGPGNWCGAGPGPGDENCLECCVEAMHTDGVCLDYTPSQENQGCLCRDG